MALMEEFFPGKGENLHDYLIPRPETFLRWSRF